MLETPDFTQLNNFDSLSQDQSLEKSQQFLELMMSRRTIRHFSSRPVDKTIIKNAIRAAGYAPSGANKQPWFFPTIYSPEIKRAIRIAAEKEERAFYSYRASEVWLNDLKHLGTDANKEYLEKAPCIIGVFAKTKETELENTSSRTYFPLESTCIATGILITALHNAGLATLTHTPRPMGFINKILELDKTYKPLVLLVTGYPETPIKVPSITKKSFDQISKSY